MRALLKRRRNPFQQTTFSEKCGCCSNIPKVRSTRESSPSSQYLSFCFPLWSFVWKRFPNLNITRYTEWIVHVNIIVIISICILFQINFSAKWVQFPNSFDAIIIPSYFISIGVQYDCQWHKNWRRWSAWRHRPFFHSWNTLHHLVYVWIVGALPLMSK